jgi:hypothetical protein
MTVPLRSISYTLLVCSAEAESGEGAFAFAGVASDLIEVGLGSFADDACGFLVVATSEDESRAATVALGEIPMRLLEAGAKGWSSLSALTATLSGALKLR